ncbi:hypothetical protein [Acetobacter orleanensis]|uniref:Uncharacterized protein n=1 Tax=Acetobacter orleanensis TaxID=104099 RepID=A0A4Y3TSH0_9PROT|nr:hypothetical protein [Acetobacter orleanensis]KXV66004.1 hypothetical protein AD949_03450 [Acetobacter orleanensis]PCD78509.1 hypothetical protein CO710_11880 [Acetobacter orleanensis]GAN69575.1 hypothetical protein Abol_047_010 [Acetobacter orleanensis JCM 7639]GBR28796.1 hypothetical protein AA0473_1850 [Acetobacter orleanensis NRIC 0473]GEB83705.1 hypothetical protein AOR01nite_21820 [Acetobacter orleanensis]
MTYKEFVARQKAEFIRQYVEDIIYCWVRVDSKNNFRTRTQKTDKDKVSGGLEELEGFNGDDAIVWIGNKNSDNVEKQPELWVKPNSKDEPSLYREAWKKFSRIYGGVDVTELDQIHHLDHLHPETTAAKNKDSYVRLMPIPARSNILVGAVIEKVQAQNDYLTGGFTAYDITLCKVLGLDISFRREISADEIIDTICLELEKVKITTDDELQKALYAWLDFRRKKPK